MKKKRPIYKQVRLEPDVAQAVRVAAFESGRGVQGEVNYQLRQVYAPRKIFVPSKTL